MGTHDLLKLWRLHGVAKGDRRRIVTRRDRRHDKGIRSARPRWGRVSDRFEMEFHAEKRGRPKIYRLQFG